MNNKIYDIIFFVGGTVLMLLGLFSTLDEWEGFFSDATDWYDILLMITGISMIVFGFVRNSWDKQDKQ